MTRPIDFWKITKYALILLTLIAFLIYFPYITITLSFLPLIVILAVLSLYALLKIKLNAKTATWLMILMLYANAFRPLGIYPILSISLDIIAIFLISKHILKDNIKRKSFPLISIISLFVFVAFLEMFNPNIPSVQAGLEGFRKTALPFIMFYVGVLSVKDKDEIQTILRKISLSSILIIIYGMKQYFLSSNFDKLFVLSNNADMYTGMIFGQIRATSIFSGAFHFGMFSAVMAVINLYLLEVAPDKKEKMFWGIGIVFSIVSCYTSLTRTNMIALMTGIIFYKLIQIKSKHASIVFPFISVISVFSAYFFGKFSSNWVNLSNPLLRMVGTIVNFAEDSRFLGRIDGWKEIIRLVSEQPFIAYGTGSAGDTLQYTYLFDHHITSHNFFLKVLMEMGVIGFILIIIFFIFLILILLRKSLKSITLLNKKTSAMCLGVLIVFIVNAIVGSAIEANPVSNLILLILGFGVAPTKNVKNESP